MSGRIVRQLLAAYTSAPQAMMKESAPSTADGERPLTAPNKMTQTSGVPQTQEKPPTELPVPPIIALSPPCEKNRRRLAFPLACVSVAAPPVLCIVGAVQASVNVGFCLPMFAVYASLGVFVATSVLLVGVALLEQWESRVPFSVPPGELFSLPGRPDFRP